MMKAAGVGARAPAKKKAAALAAEAMANKVHKAAATAAAAEAAQNDSLMLGTSNGSSNVNADEEVKDLAPAGGWLRWLKRRLETQGPSGMKPRDTFTRLEERSMDPRLLGRAPTLTNHFLFHCADLTSYTQLHLAHPRFAIPHDTGTSNDFFFFYISFFSSWSFFNRYFFLMQALMKLVPLFLFFFHSLFPITFFFLCLPP
jgi:hypothetical protein